MLTFKGDFLGLKTGVDDLKEEAGNLVELDETN
jgi:hypothetical protein